MLHIRCSNDIIFRKSLIYTRYDYDDRKNSQEERGERKMCSTTGFATLPLLLCSHIKTTCLIFLCPNFLTSEREIL